MRIGSVLGYRRARWLMAIAAGLATVAIVAIALSDSDESRDGAALGNRPPDTGNGLPSVSWVRDFESIEELVEVGAIVVLGTATPDRDTVAIGGGGALFTDTVVRVDRLVAGELAVSDQSLIVVRQTGGELGDQRLDIEGLRLLHPGENALLFLRFDANRDVYFVVGGAHGHFTIEGDVLRHANLENPDHDLVRRHDGRAHPLVDAVSGRSLTEVEADVRDAARDRG